MPNNKNVSVKEIIALKNNDLILNALHEISSEIPNFKNVRDLDTDSADYINEYKTNSSTFSISFIELVIFNKYLHSMYLKRKPPISILSYGNTDSSGKLSYGGAFSSNENWWFICKFDDSDNEYIFNTNSYLDNRRGLICQLQVSVKNMCTIDEIETIYKNFKQLSFNNSEYVGKCIKVKFYDSSLIGVEIVDLTEKSNDLILTDIQEKYIEHFINRIRRGSNARYLLNGEPGTGKTESIREIIRKLTPQVTFIIPEFEHVSDLSAILNACEIFDNGVIIMDDIDLYLGSRDNGNYTKFLGEFLSFFDGVKKRKISLLASTNDKGLVDKAAERPGRFNMTLDYTYLTHEQIIKVCNIHLPEKYRIDKVYEALTGTVGGRKIKITGAFIANLSDNIKEMSEDEENWSVDDTISLINESYKGFYMSQYDKNNNNIGFKTN